MKNKLLGVVTAVMLLPLTSWAGCPELSGAYRCQVSLFSVNLTVDQSELRGVTTYQIDGADIIADGREHVAEKLPRLLDRYVRDVRYTADCKDEEVHFSGQGTTKRDRKEASVSGTLKKTSSAKLIIKFSYQKQGGKERTFTGSCRLKK